MKRLMFYAMLIGLTLATACKKEKKETPVPENKKPVVVPKPDPTSGYFSFSDENWIYSMWSIGEYEDEYIDTITKTGDTLIDYNGELLEFKKMRVVSSIIYGMAGNAKHNDPFHVYYCYKTPKMIKAYWEAGMLNFNEEILKISEMDFLDSQLPVIDTLFFGGKQFLTLNVQLDPSYEHNQRNNNFIFGISLAGPGKNILDHYSKDGFQSHTLKYTADGQSVELKP